MFFRQTVWSENQNLDERKAGVTINTYCIQNDVHIFGLTISFRNRCCFNYNIIYRNEIVFIVDGEAENYTIEIKLLQAISYASNVVPVSLALHLTLSCHFIKLHSLQHFHLGS